MEPVTTAIAAFAAAGPTKKAIEGVVDQIHELGKRLARDEVAKWKVKNKLDRLYTKARDIRFVKTIWQYEKQVDIASFYCPTHLSTGAPDRTRYRVDDVDHFRAKGNLLVLGTIGQGKSIFFRYLASRELQRGRCIPLFVELRRIGRGESLLEHLGAEMAALGVKTEQSVLEFLLEHGKVMLFLDAFDEVLESEQATVVRQVEDLTRTNPATKVLVSARPGTSLEGSNQFSIVHVAKLENKEYQTVVRRMVDDQEMATAIIKGVEAQAHVKTLLDTPLMVALLVIRFKAEQSIPENTAAFYEGLFGLMMQRHDKLKPGYVRPRKCKLSDGQIEEVFSAFCYLSRKQNASAFKAPELRKLMSSAAETLGIGTDAESVVRDISSITCLLLDDGGEYKFIHKSVQEFHAACFVRDSGDEHATTFYEAMKSRWRHWRQDLAFLSIIDRDRHDRHFKIPRLCEALGLASPEEAPSWKYSLEMAKAVFSDLKLAIVRVGKSTSLEFAGFFETTEPESCPWAVCVEDRIGTFSRRLVREFAKSGELAQRLMAKEPEPHVIQADVGEWIANQELVQCVDTAAAQVFQEIHADLTKTISEVNRRAAHKALFTF